MSISRRITSGNRRRFSTLRAPMTIALGFASAIASTAVLADVQVRGNPSAVSVVAQNASIGEILINLGSAFGVKLRSSANLEKQLTGSYRGSLPQVLARVLAGYDFILKSEKGEAVITVLGSGKAIAELGTSPQTEGAKRRAAAVAGSAAGTRPMPTTALGEGPRPGPASASPMLITMVGEGPRPVLTASAEPMPITTAGEGPRPAGPMPTTTTGQGPSAGPMPTTTAGEGLRPGPSTTTGPMPTSTSGEGPRPKP